MTRNTPSGRSQSEKCSRFDESGARFEGHRDVTVRVLYAEYVTDTWITDWIDNLLSHADQLRAAGASRALARGRQVPSSWSPLGRLLASLRASGPSRSYRRRHERGQLGHPRLDRRPHVWWSCIPHPRSRSKVRRLCPKSNQALCSWPCFCTIDERRRRYIWFHTLSM